MNTIEIEEFFIKPNSKIGYGLYATRKSLIKAVTDLKAKISGDVLDLGCGIMPYKTFLQSNGKINNYIGVDLQNSNYHNQVIPDLYWDGIVIPVIDNSQDWVIVTEFLEHYFDTQHILKEIKRVLKPGGSVFFTFPCIYMIHEAPYDYNRFTPFSIKMNFENAGFTKTNIYPLGGFNYSLVIMMSLWNKKSGQRGLVRLFSKLFLFLFYKSLLHYDDKIIADKSDFSIFQNDTTPSGLWGYGRK